MNLLPLAVNAPSASATASGVPSATASGVPSATGTRSAFVRARLTRWTVLARDTLSQFRRP